MTPFRLALLLVLIAVLAAWQVTVIPESAMQMTVGPVLAPAVVVAVLLVIAIVYGVSAWRGRQIDESLAEGQEPLPGSARRLLFLLGGGAAFIALVQPLGFIVPAALCGMGVAHAFDAPLRWPAVWKTAAVCGAIAAAFWLIFAKLLGVGLGPAFHWPF